MARDYSAYERESYGWVGDTPPRPQLSPELLGCMLICTWRMAAIGTSAGAFATEVIPVGMLLQSIADQTSVPKDASGALHWEQRVGGAQLLEPTQILTGIESAGLAVRTNPDNAVMVVQIDSMQAFGLFKQYAVYFPEEASWVEQFVERQISALERAA